ncbi:MAG TPA: hypothetical protein VJM83_00620, partial [Nitrospirota bacterium]|nr:hypothetical protein [Nitrospirota bacterium]
MEEKRAPEEGPQGPVDEPRGGRAEERGDAGGDVQDALAPDGAGGAEGLAPEKAEPPTGGLKSKASMLAAAAMKAW